MHDVLIRNVSIIDGTGKPAYEGSIGITGDRITLVAPGCADAEAAAYIDGKRLTCCPGFIDIHSHADSSLPFFPEVANNIMQGVTTFVGGNCGIGLAPAMNPEFVEGYLKKGLLLADGASFEWKTFGDWLDYMDKTPIGPNYVPLVAHNPLRGSVMGMDYARASTLAERKKICALLNEALDAGAFGMSYSADAGVPGHHADRAELDALFEILEERQSLVTAHTRHHQNQWPSEDGRSYYGVYVGEKGDVLCGRYHGLWEFVEYCRRKPRLRCMISHLTNAFVVPIPHGQAMEDAMIDETLRVFVEEPVAEGCDLYFNLIPANQSISNLCRVTDNLTRSLHFDPVLREYADEKRLVKALADRSFRSTLREYINGGKFKMGMLSPATDPYWSDCFMFFKAADPSLLGKTLLEVTKERMGGTRQELVYQNCLEVLFDLVEADPSLEWALVKDKREYQGYVRLLQNPRGMPMSDTRGFPREPNKDTNFLGYGNPPIAYSIFIRYLVDVVFNGGALSLEEAIYKITALPAHVMSLTQRGRLAEGCYADVVLLDLHKLAYHSDFTKPSLAPEGIVDVWVNGTLALKDGEPTEAKTGRVLRNNRN